MTFNVHVSVSPALTIAYVIDAVSPLEALARPYVAGRRIARLEVLQDGKWQRISLDTL
jgi:hypothetical protein